MPLHRFRAFVCSLGILIAFMVLTAPPVQAAADTTSYEYDDLGRLKKVTYPDGANVQYSLDAAGNRTQVNSTVTGGSPGSLQFSAASYSVGEGAGSIAISIQRIGGSYGAVSVDINPGSVTATTGVDFTSVPTTLTWLSGDTTPKNYTITITQDSLVEGNETAGIWLYNETGGVGLPENYRVLTIVDDDSGGGGSPGSLQFSAASYSVGEGGGSATISIQRVGGSTGAVSVDINPGSVTATTGVDFTSVPTTLSWASGNTATKNYTITITQDSLVEGNETAGIWLYNQTGGVGLPENYRVLTIVDDDSGGGGSPGSLQFSAASYSVGEGGGSATISIQRVGGSTGAVSVDINTSSGTATQGVDFTNVPTTLSWASGNTATKTFTVTITQDALFEGNETAGLWLYNVSGGASVPEDYRTLTIVDDD